MSGGSLEYVFLNVEQAAVLVRRVARSDPLRLAFADHLDKVARALHDIEWVLSGDYAPGDEVEALRAVVSPAMELESARALAVEAADRLAEMLTRLRAPISDITND